MKSSTTPTSFIFYINSLQSVSSVLSTDKHQIAFSQFTTYTFVFVCIAAVTLLLCVVCMHVPNYILVCSYICKCIIQLYMHAYQH